MIIREYDYKNYEDYIEGKEREKQKTITKEDMTFEDYIGKENTYNVVTGEVEKKDKDEKVI